MYGAVGQPHTVVNERLHRHELGVLFFAQSQDEQDRAAIIIVMGILQIGFRSTKILQNQNLGYQDKKQISADRDILRVSKV